MLPKSTLIFAALISMSFSLPAITLRQFCPVGQAEGNVFEGPRLIKVNESPSRKVRIQFFYPSLSRSIDTVSQEEATTTESQLVLSDEQDELNGISTTVEDVTTESPLDYDLNCQWEFQAGNESQFLLLTFDKLSAPYSEDCAEAYVAMQKQNGYESRWCGSRRQPNARPMSLFSRSGAKVSVFRSTDAPLFPSTGFSVIVEAVDISAVHGTDTKLRLLEG